MHASLPIKFDNVITINYSTGVSENTDVFPGSAGLVPCTFNKNNGYDANNIRFTNLVGFNGTDLLKKCPKCERDLPTLSYGESGRMAGVRDQSQCTSCRSGR